MKELKSNTRRACEYGRDGELGRGRELGNWDSRLAERMRDTRWW